jgi:hypothetical protein
MEIRPIKGKRVTIRISPKRRSERSIEEGDDGLAEDVRERVERKTERMIKRDEREYEEDVPFIRKRTVRIPGKIEISTSTSHKLEQIEQRRLSEKAKKEVDHFLREQRIEDLPADPEDLKIILIKFYERIMGRTKTFI